MTHLKNLKAPRIEMVDALRGFAIMSIMLLHNIEHFEYVYLPENLPNWLQIIDKAVWNTMFFIFGGKSYAIFALLFGFSYYIQNQNQQNQGKDFKLRFLWRLTLLMGFGIINTVFYQGDILTMYALLGASLLPVTNISNKNLFIVATILMLQPLEICKIASNIITQNYQQTPNLSESYYAQIGNYMKNGNFLDYAIGNLTLGKIASLLWSFENGRFFQAPALFMYGMLLGRTNYFSITPQSLQFWKKSLKIATISFVPLYIFAQSIPQLPLQPVIANHLKIIFSSWSNFAFMVIIVALFILLYQKNAINQTLNKLIPFGKMSLTNYIMQSMIGSFIYYRYGLGLFEYAGSTCSLLIGIVLFALQLRLCTWWLQKHKQGPLEKLWHKATWISKSRVRNSH